MNLLLILRGIAVLCLSLMDSDMSELMALSHNSDQKLERLKSLNIQVELFGNSEDLAREEREIKQWLNQYYNYLMSIMSQASQEPFEEQEDDIQ